MNRRNREVEGEKKVGRRRRRIKVEGGRNIEEREGDGETGRRKGIRSRELINRGEKGTG